VLQLNPHVEVVCTYLRTEEGGRSSPAFSGYRPQFYYNGENFDGQHDLVGVEKAFPGETVTSRVTFAYPQYHAERVHVGMEFELREGSKVVARGKVTKILTLASVLPEPEPPSNFQLP